MHHISRVSVEGFWDTHDLELNLFPEVTFLIGPNGTGKTTLINLISAALTVDFRNLDRIPFKKISINLDGSGDDGPRITVLKNKKKDRPFDLIEYRIRSGGRNTHETRYSLEDIEDHLVRRYASDTRFGRDYYRYMPSELGEKIQGLVKVNWLSVHRTPIIERPRDERPYESAVDQRLETISNDLVRFFSTLSQRKDDEVRKFQESIFISLVDNQKVGDLFDTSSLEDIDKFVDVLNFIFAELHVSQDHSNDLLREFMSRGHQVTERIHRSPKDRGMDIDDAVYLLGLRRISAIVDRWNSLQERLTDIFAPRDRWLKIANDLFQRKKMQLTSSNELQFISRSGKILKTNMLSSGEKQLLILLSETLLQREMPTVFIADEPEISLHVLWQEKLVSSLRSLNPSAQIIFATHSPDIVGGLSKRAIDMETIIP